MDQITMTQEDIINAALETLATRETMGVKPVITVRELHAHICGPHSYFRKTTSFGNVKEVMDANFKSRYDGKEVLYSV